MKSVMRVIWFFVLLLVLFAFGYGWRDIRQGRAPAARAWASLFDTALNPNSQETPTEEFTNAYDRIRADYYKAVPPQDLTYAGMEGLMASLGDPHTMFLRPKIAQEFNLETEANFVGVGARLASDPLGAKVVVVFDNSPASRAGLKVNDVITQVNGKSMVGAQIDDIVSKIRGESGTQVHLGVLRMGSQKPIELVATRASVITPTVWDTKVIPGTQIGYFSVASFSKPTADQFQQEIKKLEGQHIRGLILDMRDNPGGLLDTARDMLSMFVENKVVVKMKGRDDREEVAMTYTGEKHDFNYPIAILINEDSASAAEIFSGVLQDYRLATLVGTHSYGKASVQNVMPLVGGSSAKITIARYYLPRGKDISRKVDEDGQYVSGGLTPDVPAELDLDKQVTLGDIKSDSQLAKAVDVIQAKIQ